MSTAPFQHRATGSKQQNKPFKSGKHKSKGEIKRTASGKVQNERNEGFKGNAKQMASDSKMARKLRAKQIAQNKRNAAMKNNRVGLGDSPPRVVAIIGLTPSANCVALQQSLVNSIAQSDPHCLPVNSDEGKKIGGVTVCVSRFKTRVTFYPVPNRETIDLLDIAKVADVLLFISHAPDVLLNEAVADARGLQIINLMKEQGLPEVIGAVQSLDQLPVKLRGQCKKACSEFFERQIHSKIKVLPIDSESDLSQFTRFLCEQAVVPLPWRQGRPYMLVDNINWVPNDLSIPAPGQFGTLYLSGYLRGHALNVDNILHITGYGDVQIDRIIGGADPYAFQRPREAANTMAIEGGVQVEKYALATADLMNRESLERENTPDPFASEQTWPTPEELELAERERRTEVKRVPPGTNPYQAAWIPDFGDDDEESQSGDDEKMEKDEPTQKPQKVLPLETEQEVVMQKEDVDETFESESDQKMEMKDPIDVAEEEKDDLVFPDEIDTPEDIPARIRFQKYRGVKSFRTSPWDPKENLPFDYAKIFQFENFRRTFTRIKKEHTGIQPGPYVTLCVSNVASNQFSLHPEGRPLVCSGLFKFENKVSVVNFIVNRLPTYTEPMKTKAEVLVQAGFRRFLGFPLYSEYNLNGDKFKRMKFLRGSGVASFYGPVCFPPTPLLFLGGENRAELIASGNLHSVNPDHIILKKIVLSGIPTRVHKGKAIVKKMFFHPDDVRWFRPVELWTKYGRVGRIVEPVGTHGEMKCSFDSSLTQQDTIMMSLYKRVYPKWVVFPELIKPQ